MQLCAGVVGKLKVTTGHAIEFGPRQILLVGDREQAGLGLEEAGFCTAVFELRRSAFVQVAHDVGHGFFREQGGAGKRGLSRGDGTQVVLDLGQLPGHFRFQFRQDQFVDLARGAALGDDTTHFTIVDHTPGVGGAET